MRCTMTVVITAALLASPGLAEAQSDLPVQVGQRVRVAFLSDQAPSPILWVGMVNRVTADSLVLASGARISVAGIQNLQVSDGMTRRVGVGLLVGAAVGFVAGVLTSGCTDCADDYSVVSGKKIAIGTLLGGLFGAFIKRERWLQVPLEARAP